MRVQSYNITSECTHTPFLKISHFSFSLSAKHVSKLNPKIYFVSNVNTKKVSFSSHYKPLPIFVPLYRSPLPQ